MSKGRIVLVTNTKKIPNIGYGKYMYKFDVLKNITNFLLAKAIKCANYDLTWYNNVPTFREQILNHKNDLVFPYCHGISSKIRQSFVQTFCESENINYLGAEAYTQTVANDKMLSKEICRHAGIATPNCKIMFATEYPPDISVLQLPLIVKPQFEGDSIGISDKNVFHSYDGIISFAAKLIEDLGQPVIIEEYIGGKELSVCMIGYKRNIKKIGVVEIGKGESLVKSFRDKKFTIGPRIYKEANSLLTPHLLSQVEALFHSLDKIEFMRADFIYKDGVFYNIELTADPDLSPLSSMYFAFKKDIPYIRFIDFLIQNCKERYSVIQ